MLEESLKHYLNGIDHNIDIHDFNTIERNFEYSLRFELGDKLKNGTKKRVNQSFQRASEIFKDCFVNDIELFVLSYEWEDELFSRTPSYLGQTINSNNSIIEGMLATRYFEDEKPEYHNGKIQVFETSIADLDYKSVLKGIANTEMGFDPCVHQIVFFFGQTSGKVYWMYDDRGCLIMAKEPKQLMFDFEKHKEWLCEGYEEKFESVMKNCS